jgi:predicted permease
MTPNLDLSREPNQNPHTISFLESLAHDLRYAFRGLRRDAGFFLAAILIIGLGIGANTLIFSLVDTLLLRPLPFRNSAQLVWIRNSGSLASGLSGATTQVGNFLDWRSYNHSFEELTGYYAFSDYGTYTMSGAGEPEDLGGMAVAQNFLPFLGIQPALGRNFTEDEARFNAPGTVLLTRGFWIRRFAANPAVVGTTITLNDKPVTIIGVLPASFDFSSTFTPASHVDVITPFPLTEETSRQGNALAVIGRIKPSVSIASAQAEFDQLKVQIRAAHPERNTAGAQLIPLQQQISGPFRSALWVLLAAVGAVLLIVCANLSNLLLARGASRQKEMALRMALGANRSRLIRQMLTESLLLSCCGAIVGISMAFAAARLVAGLQAVRMPMLHSVTVDSRALIFTTILAALTGLIFGIVPALQVSSGDLNETLKDGSRSAGTSTRKAYFRAALVVSEIALACILVAGAGLLIRSFVKLLDVNPGFRADHAAAWRIETANRYPKIENQVPFYNRITQAVSSIPGVTAVGIADTLPLGRNRNWVVAAKGVVYPRGQRPTAMPRIIDPGYLDAMKIPLIEGRVFTARDDAKSEPVLIVNQTMARALWPNQDALGQIVNKDARVVGVVGDVRHGALDEKSSNEMYLPMAQLGVDEAMELVVRSTVPPESLSPSIRAVFKSVDPLMPGDDYETLDQIVDRAVSPRRFIVSLLAGFAALALVLASIGVYAVISYSVSQRVQEIGIRMALGASPAAVRKLILTETMRLAAIGIAIGLIGSLTLMRLVSTLLYGVTSRDALTLSITVAVLSTVALTAGYIPALRASRIEPMSALRSS